MESHWKGYVFLVLQNIPKGHEYKKYEALLSLSILKSAKPRPGFQTRAFDPPN